MRQDKDYFNKIEYPSVIEEIIEQILEAIKNNVFVPGTRLPGEPDLAQQFGVSRNTLREALNILIEQGFIYRQRGIGTFVTPQSERILNTNLVNMIGTTSLISSQNKKPGQTNFTYRFELPTKVIAKNLKIPETQRVMHVSRVRTADGVPVIASEEYFPEGIDGLDYDLEKYKDEENWSIYGYFSNANHPLNSALTSIHAVSADEAIARELKIEIGVPLLCLEQVHYSNESISPLLFCSNYHNDKIMNVLLVRSLSLSK